MSLQHKFLRRPSVRYQPSSDKLTQAQFCKLYDWADEFDHRLNEVMHTGKGRYNTMMISDVFDLRNVIKTIQRGNWKQLPQVAWDMDTIVREWIPVKIWNLIHKLEDE